MCIKKNKKKRPPLQPKVGPYKKTNAYTSKPCFEQIITIILMVILIVLHSVFNVAAIIAINNSILWVILIFHYVLLAFIIVVYIIITIRDPVDDYILDPYLALTDNYREYCEICVCYRQERSYHCKRCNRCTEKFDHHCKYLNNCIGGKNYKLFIILLTSFILFHMSCIGQSIWVFVRSRNDLKIAQAAISEWVCIGIITLATVLMSLSIVLCCFHMYISLCLDLSTLEFYESSENDKKSEKNRNSNDAQIKKMDL